MSIFTYDTDGKVGIGKLPIDLLYILDDISKDYYHQIPDKSASTFHTWYSDMNKNIKSKIELIQKNKFWNKLCDGDKDKCIIINANEMDELYYSNPKNKLDKINLYGSISNYDKHKDGVYNFNGIKFYRVIIGLTNGNNNIITYFNNLNVGHKINKGDYIVFDFDKTTHQVIKDKDEMTPRILLKLHFIVCENGEYSYEYLNTIKQLYIYYEHVTRYIMKTGTDPETYYQFFMGLACQYLYTPYIQYFVLFIISLIVIEIKYVFKIKLIYKNIPKIIKYTIFSLITIYLSIVFFYWFRYKTFGIK